MSNSKTLVHRISSQSITVILDGKVRVLNSKSSNFPALEAAIKAGKDPAVGYDLDLIRDLVDISSFIARETHGLITISDNQVRYKGEKQSGKLVERILQHLDNGYPTAPLAFFMEKLMSNPNVDVRSDLFAWLESGDMPIADDGDIIAFKKVQEDYYSFRSGKNGKVLHEMGSIVEIPREEVDPNRYNECSTGLHFCSYGYLSHYEGNRGRVLIVKINPADVVAIPTDYGRQKGRTFRMFVYDEIDQQEAQAALSGKLVAPKTGLIAQEKTARISGIDDNSLGNDGEGSLITAGRLRGLLAHGGVAYAAEMLKVSEDRVDALAEMIDFKREHLGVLPAPKTEAELAEEAEAKKLADAELARQQKFIGLFGGDLETARAAINIIDDEIVKNGGDTHLILKRLNNTSPSHKIAARFFVDGKGDFAAFTRLYHEFRGLAPADGLDGDVVAAPVSNVASTVKVQAGDEASTQVVAVKAKAKKGISFSHKGANYTSAFIAKEVKAHGQRGFSTKYGVPRSTLQGWLKALSNT